ncbi:MAG: valine--tRNA ligase [Gammaproteobacteria bacterium]|nr:valine--tRNA ligase [Gammaproteobacteria bacterium]
MEKTYDPHAIEQDLYAKWEENNFFNPEHNQTVHQQTSGNPYCIMIPPPNVTGSLHMGHGFNNTVVDTLIRYRRMKGDKTLWQAGTDHAGIATQMVVERQLEAQGKTRHDLGRENFVEKIWDWREESGGHITRQLRRLGSSLDWESERFTMDDGLSDAVQEVFIRLHEEGLIYRGKRLVNWDTKFHTAVSDLEVLSEEENGYMWHMKYPLADGSGHVTVATTRPETMLGDCAVAIAPGDERYTHLLGKMIALPLTNREIPIIEDEHVDAEFGTGCVKVTPAHDFNDYDVWKRHNTEDAVKSQPHGGLINLFTIDAAIRENDIEVEDDNDLIPAAYIGMDRYVARKQVVKDLDALGLLEKVDDHKLMVPRGDRSGTVIEPFLTDQWYVKVGPLARPAIDAVETGRIKFVPDNWKNTYYEWMNNIQDWCISRQIWWGHRIPAWYDEDGGVYVGRSEQEVREQNNIADSVTLKQDEDVLDTWFSSALWPFSTLGWPNEDAQRVKDFYPNQVLVTGFDIIFFWVARMIMFGLKFMDNQVPFHEVYVHGLVRDSHGDKMSKSKGNVLDPIDLIDGIDLETLVTKRTQGMMQPKLAAKIEKQTRKDFPDGIASYGTDALRFTFASLATTGRDVKFDMGRIEGYRNFCNKIWNASRYVLQNAEQNSSSVDGGRTPVSTVENTSLEGDIELSLADQWILERLKQISASTAKYIDSYRLDLVAKNLYEFVWNDYCDWYIELSKPVLYSDSATEAQLRGTRQTLIKVLETALRLMHPIMPYITEELWQKIAPLAGVSGESIMLQSYPEADEAHINQDVIDELEWVKSFIMGVRQIRSEMNIKPSELLPVLLENGSEIDLQRLNNNRTFVMSLAKLKEITWLEANEQSPESATSLVGNMKLLIPLAGLIDKDAELSRLQKHMDKTEQDAKRINGKLNNANFVDKAPDAVVAKEREKLADIEAALANLKQQHAKINAM